MGRSGGLLRLLRGRRRNRRIKTSTPLRFLHEVLGLEHLHYGLWEGEEVNFAGLVRAQQRYADHLISWMPKEATSILDVGAGVGTTSLALSRLGFEVEGLSPDPFQRDAFVERTRLPFHLARFQDFEPERVYDLVLMSESAQYIWLKSIFPSVARVAPGGHLLVADYFVTAGVDSQDHPVARSGHRLDDFDRLADESGLILLREEDITEAVLPTLELLSTWVERFAEPSVAIFGDWISGRYARVGALVGAKVRAELVKTRDVVAAESFRNLKRYLIRLYRVP